jgi:hypothetical protein
MAQVFQHPQPHQQHQAGLEEAQRDDAQRRRTHVRDPPSFVARAWGFEHGCLVEVERRGNRVRPEAAFQGELPRAYGWLARS